MVAAALAAMTVGAYAEEEEETSGAYVYDLSISVKTTKGKAGKSAKTDYNYYGKGADGWWYNDEEFTTGPWAYIKTANKGSAAGKHGPWTIEQKAVDALDFADQMELAGILEPYTDLDPSDNGGAWCLRIKWLIPAECYRVSTSKSLKAYAITDSCCESQADGEGLGWQFVLFAKSSWALNNIVQLWEDGEDAKTCYGTLTFDFLYRIGGVGEKATKVEGYATSEFKEDYGAFAGGNLKMAGQGSFDKKNGLMKSISGNVAGYLGASSCPANCCESDYAFAYDCDGVEIIGELIGMTIEEINEELKAIPTAAYGSWSLKYNASATKKLNKAFFEE